MKKKTKILVSILTFFLASSSVIILTTCSMNKKSYKKFEESKQKLLTLINDLDLETQNDIKKWLIEQEKKLNTNYSDTETIIKDIDEYTKKVYEKLENFKEVKKENLTEFKKNKDALKKILQNSDAKEVDSNEINRALNNIQITDLSTIIEIKSALKQVNNLKKILERKINELKINENQKFNIKKLELKKLLNSNEISSVDHMYETNLFHNSEINDYLTIKDIRTQRKQIEDAITSLNHKIKIFKDLQNKEKKAKFEEFKSIKLQIDKIQRTQFNGNRYIEIIKEKSEKYTYISQDSNLVDIQNAIKELNRINQINEIKISIDNSTKLDEIKKQEFIKECENLLDINNYSDTLLNDLKTKIKTAQNTNNNIINKDLDDLQKEYEIAKNNVKSKLTILKNKTNADSKHVLANSNKAINSKIESIISQIDSDYHKTYNNQNKNIDDFKKYIDQLNNLHKIIALYTDYFSEVSDNINARIDDQIIKDQIYNSQVINSTEEIRSKLEYLNWSYYTINLETDQFIQTYKQILNSSLRKTNLKVFNTVMDNIFQTAREPHSNKYNLTAVLTKPNGTENDLIFKNELTTFKGYKKLIIKFKKQNEYNETAKGIYQENGKWHFEGWIVIWDSKDNIYYYLGYSYPIVINTVEKPSN